MNKQAMERTTFEAGTRLFKEGEVGDKAYLVVSGMIEIVKQMGENETMVVASLGKGEIVGEMALIDDAPRAASARVVEHAELVIIDRANMEARLAGTDPVVKQLLKVFVNRLRTELHKSAQRTPIVR